MHSVILSPYSRLFYVEWKLDQSRCDYNIVFDQQLEGELNIAKLDNALQRFINDYVILNSHIEERGDDLYWVKNDKAWGLEYFKEKLTNEKVFSYLCKPFDLEKEPLYRFALIALGKDKYRFIVVLHHIIIDGLSFDYFIGELSCYYNDWNHKANVSIEEQLVSMSQLSQQLWESVNLNKEKSKLFWKEQLIDMEPLKLDFLKINSSVNSLLTNSQKNSKHLMDAPNNIGEIRFDFYGERLKKLKGKYNVTPYLYCQSIYALLLHRYSGQNNFCINYPVAIKKGMSFIYGSQININIVPYDFTQVKNVLDLIKKSQFFIKSLQSDSVDHSCLPSLDIASISSKSIFELPCSKTNLKDKKFEFDNIKVNKNENTEIDLSSELFFEQQIQEDIINFRMRYRSDIIDSDLINAFIMCYKRLFVEALDQLLENTDANELPGLEDYNICSHKQFEQIVKTWNQTDTSYPNTETIPRLFEEQVAKAPCAIAVVKDNQSLTYQELNKLSNQLAYYLREHGVGRATRIGIAFERSFEMIIGFLGILKAGATYVPLDPTYPKDRLQFMIEDSNVPIILTDVQTIDKLPATWAQTICLDEEYVHIKTLPETNLKNFILPDNLAYIIYTSGSTGKPKGVAITHQCLVASSWARMLYYSELPLNLPIFSSISFDITTGLVFWCVLQGGSLFLPPEDIQQHPIELIRYIREHKVTHITFVPSVYNLLLQYKELSELTSLKLVFLGGEECPKYLVLKHIESLPNIPLYNEYGPTENTVWTTVDQLYSAVSKVGKEYITIGKPRLNTKVYILDKYLNPTPVGAIGEIYIAGSGLAEGYLNQPDLTAEKFIPNPFVVDASQKQLRLYRTGDIARYLPGGDIEFKARVDEQVKIRGFRVELGEVESIIKTQGNAAQVVVIARGDGLGDKKLVAYIVPEDVGVASFNIFSTHTSSSGFSFSILSQESISNIQEDLRRKLALFLPDYMIPSFFIYLDKFPLNPNGKLDKGAFPEPGVVLSEDKYIGPRTELESKMCEVWAEVLDINQGKLGIRDNFFRLGGNSVLAIKLSSKINEEFKNNINVSEIFKHNTIEALVHYLKDGINNSWDVEIPVVEGSEAQMLSFAQERLWFVEKYEEGSNAYNIFMVFKLAKQVDLDLIKRSIKSIIVRHEILRTLIKEDNGGRGYQLVCDEKELPFIIDKVEVNDRVHLDGLLEKQVNRVFDLSSEYPIKVCLYGLNNPSVEDTEFYIGIVIHHIAFDGWSVDIFIRELQNYYDYYLKELQGLKPSLNLPNLILQYKDFALLQRRFLTAERIEKQLNYWKSKLENYETLSLVTDRVRPVQIDYKGHDISFELDERTSNALRDLAKELKVSLYSLLLGSYCLLLRIYSHQDDIVIGSPVANRHYKQVENLIGFFVNSLALRIQINLQGSVKEFIQKLGEEVIDAQLHQDLPFEKLVEELKVPKDPSRHPIFQVMFAVHNFGGKLYNADSEEDPTNVLQTYIPQKSIYNVAKFDISTIIDDSQPCLKVGINYAISLYNEETIQGFIRTYIEILKQFAELANDAKKQEETKLFQLSYINERQYEEIIYRWNCTDKMYPNHKTVHQLFEEQVEYTPHNVALVYGAIKLTYRQLNEKANQLANYLISRCNIKPGTLIILCVDRNEHMLISILAVLKTGAAYVPIDPNYPKERKKYILKDTQAVVILTNSIYKEGLETLKSEIAGFIEIIAIDDKVSEQAFAAEATNNPMTVTTSTDLAYVIYTSGTTGNPKGVMIEHQSVVNLKFALTDKYGLRETNNENILQFSNYVFDASIEQIIISLLNGFGLVLIPHHLLLEKDEFYFYLNNNKITHINVTPTFLAQHDFSDIQSLKRLILGGELINKQCYQKVASLDNCKIINAYGPTETTITSIVNVLNETNLAIGTPIFNTKCYVLDVNFNPLPVGAVGELYIGGLGLARGYLNHPQLTAEKFISNPFQTKSEKEANKNARLYKTGDLVRWLPDGKIGYIGRNDFQVKIRGYRIELGEIESVLCGYQHIKQSVVFVKEYTDAAGNATDTKYLVGYYVSEAKLNEESILEYLRTKLADYMIPNKLVYLQQLPLTVNGKLDIKALPDPKFSNMEEYIAPRTELELRISQLWAEVLGIPKDRVGIRDDFFRLGGDSIVSIQLVSRLRQRLGLNISVKDIFNYKNIEKLCDNLLNKVSESDTTIETTAEQGILEGNLPLLPIQEWFFNCNFKVAHHWNQAFTIRTPSLEKDKLESSIDKLIKYHDGFRLLFKKIKDVSLKEVETKVAQYYKAESKPEKLKVLDIRTLEFKEGSHQFAIKLQEILTNWQSNFDLEYGPIYSVAYIYGYADGSARIFFALHHLIVDTVSWRILTEDLKNIYNGKSLGLKGSSYRQWVNTVKSYANRHSQEEDYWKNVLSDYDRTDEKINKFMIGGNTQNYTNFKLIKVRTEQLLRDSHRIYHTQINDILLTALGYALYNITNSKVNHIILEGHGREEIDNNIDVSRTLGWFTTMYPVRLVISDKLDKSIRNIKEILRKIPNKGIGYGVFMGYKINNLPKISFNYLGQFDTETENQEGVQSFWNIIAEKNGVFMHPDNHDYNAININAMVINGCFQFDMVSKLDGYNTTQIKEHFKQKLEEIIDYTINQSRSYLTLSDLNNEALT